MALWSWREVHVRTDGPNNGLFKTYWPQGVERPVDTSGSDELDRISSSDSSCDLIILHTIHSYGGLVGFWNRALGDRLPFTGSDFRALKLKYPTSVQAISTLVNDETYPLAS